MTIRETEIIALGSAETPAASVSWAAVIAGALAAVSTSLILMLVGSGLGLSIVSPWSNAGATATTLAISSVIWLVVVQWLSSATGGYLSGRLRTRWAGVHSDEVTFRDTAHGFLAWALSTIIVAGLLTSVIGAIAGGAVQTAGTIGAGAVQGVAQGATQAATATGIADPTAYFVDTLFRKTPPAAAVTPAPDASQTPAPAIATSAASASVGQTQAANDGANVRSEASRILLTGLASNEMADADKSYLSQLVAGETGLSAADAEKRVNDVLAQVEAAKTKAREVADQTRKASATLAFLMALALLVGAFIASVAAVLGGSQRDNP